MKTILQQSQYNRFSKRNQFKKFFKSITLQRFLAFEMRQLQIAKQLNYSNHNKYKFNEEGD
jgi:hypothetical protein